MLDQSCGMIRLTGDRYFKNNNLHESMDSRNEHQKNGRTMTYLQEAHSQFLMLISLALPLPLDLVYHLASSVLTSRRIYSANSNVYIFLVEFLLF